MAVVVGTIIGSGVFLVTAGVPAETGSVGGVAVAWILGGIITMCGALAMPELGTLR
jgi:APA family basic amino acid/polyamine antiporter